MNDVGINTHLFFDFILRYHRSILWTTPSYLSIVILSPREKGAVYNIRKLLYIFCESGLVTSVLFMMPRLKGLRNPNILGKNLVVNIIKEGCEGHF